MADPTEGPAGGKGWVRQLGTLGHVGIMFPVSIAFGMLIGRWLDGKFDTAPWLMLAGFVVGVGAALRELLRAAATLEDPTDEDNTPRWRG
jgi:F0F1-type ATP synthase assembly protein I